MMMTRTLSVSLLLRLSPAQRERWRAAAAADGRNLSAWVRRQCDAAAPCPECAPVLCQSCHEAPATEQHTCPYAAELGDDHETLCNCCDDCAHQCAMDI